MTKYTIRDKNDKKVYIIKEKVKDAALEITIKNQDDYDEIDIIAKKLHLGFYKTKGNKAILKGHRKDLEKYVDLIYGGDTSIKEKVRDAVSLRKGDWFVINKRSDKNNYLYKVIDDQFRARDGYFYTLLAEVYQIESKYVYIKKYSTKEFLPRELKNISVFGSAAEAIKWLKHRLAIAERDIVEERVNDILHNFYIEHNGDVYSAIELKKGSDDERLFLKALKGHRIQYKKSENTHSGKGYVSYYDFR